MARQAALRELLDAWDREGGPVPEAEQGRRAGGLRRAGRPHRRPPQRMTLPVVLDARRGGGLVVTTGPDDIARLAAAVAAARVITRPAR